MIRNSVIALALALAALATSLAGCTTEFEILEGRPPESRCISDAGPDASGEAVPDAGPTDAGCERAPAESQ